MGQSAGLRTKLCARRANDWNPHKLCEWDGSIRDLLMRAELKRTRPTRIVIPKQINLFFFTFLLVGQISSVFLWWVT